MSESNQAWLMSVGPKFQIALARHEVIEYLSDVELCFVPTSHPQSCNVIFWRDQIIPLVNLANNSNSDRTDEYLTIAVLAYQDAPKLPLKYVGLFVSAAPSLIDVNDDQYCEWPDDSEGLPRELVRTSFSYSDQSVGILNIKDMCSLDWRSA